MIKYNPKFWFKHIFTFRKSDTIVVLWKEMIYIGLLTTILAYLVLNYVADEFHVSVLGKLPTPAEQMEIYKDKIEAHQEEVYKYMQFDEMDMADALYQRRDL